MSTPQRDWAYLLQEIPEDLVLDLVERDILRQHLSDRIIIVPRPEHGAFRFEVHLEDDQPQRPDICEAGITVVFVRHESLGREVSRRADAVPELEPHERHHVVPVGIREPEVGERDVAGRRDEDVLRLDISMRDSGCVYVVHCGDELCSVQL